MAWGREGGLESLVLCALLREGAEAGDAPGAAGWPLGTTVGIAGRTEKEQ